jgi:hypothetical protein
MALDLWKLLPQLQNYPPKTEKNTNKTQREATYRKLNNCRTVLLIFNCCDTTLIITLL